MRANIARTKAAVPAAPSAPLGKAAPELGDAAFAAERSLAMGAGGFVTMVTRVERIFAGDAHRLAARPGAEAPDVKVGNCRSALNPAPRARTRRERGVSEGRR